MMAQVKAIAAWGAVPARDRYAKLKKIALPVLVVNGKTDLMVPTVNSFILQQHLPDAELIIYPDSGHGGIFQFPARIRAGGNNVPGPLTERLPKPMLPDRSLTPRVVRQVFSQSFIAQIDFQTASSNRVSTCKRKTS